MEDGDTYDMPFRDRPEGNPRYKMVADVAVKVKDKRYSTWVDCALPLNYTMVQSTN